MSEYKPIALSTELPRKYFHDGAVMQLTRERRQLSLHERYARYGKVIEIADKRADSLAVTHDTVAAFINRQMDTAMGFPGIANQIVCNLDFDQDNALGTMVAKDYPQELEPGLSIYAYVKPIRSISNAHIKELTLRYIAIDGGVLDVKVRYEDAGRLATVEGTIPYLCLTPRLTVNSVDKNSRNGRWYYSEHACGAYIVILNWLETNGFTSTYKYYKEVFFDHDPSFHLVYEPIRIIHGFTTSNMSFQSLNMLENNAVDEIDTPVYLSSVNYSFVDPNAVKESNSGFGYSQEQVKALKLIGDQCVMNMVNETKAELVKSDHGDENTIRYKFKMPNDSTEMKIVYFRHGNPSVNIERVDNDSGQPYSGYHGDLDF